MLNQRIIKKEFALSGSEQNPDLTGKSWRMVVQARHRKGARRRWKRSWRRAPISSCATISRNWSARMNALAGDKLLEARRISAQIEARDREIDNPYARTRR